MSCPKCGGKAVGRISDDQYYCWECLVEFNDRDEVFEVGEDGSLVNLVAEDDQSTDERANIIL